MTKVMRKASFEGELYDGAGSDGGVWARVSRGGWWELGRPAGRGAYGWGQARALHVYVGRWLPVSRLAFFRAALVRGFPRARE